MSFDERGLVVGAVEKYIRAKSLADTLLADVIDDRLRKLVIEKLNAQKNGSMQEIQTQQLRMSHGFWMVSADQTSHKSI